MTFLWCAGNVLRGKRDSVVAGAYSGDPEFFFGTEKIIEVPGQSPSRPR